MWALGRTKKIFEGSEWGNQQVHTVQPIFCLDLLPSYIIFPPTCHGFFKIGVEFNLCGKSYKRRVSGTNIAPGALVGPKAVSDVRALFLLAPILDNLHHW